MNYFKILFWLGKGNRSMFDVPVVEQADFLGELGNPIDDFDRSFKQYKCQLFFEPKCKVLFLWILAAFSFPFVLVVLLLKGIRKPTMEPVEAAGVFRDVPEVIPEELRKKYSIKEDCGFDNFSLRFSDLGFINRLLFRYLAYPFFVLKSVINVAKYSYLMDKYQPRCVIVHAEYAFSSSLLTSYCTSKGVKHINVMHGEKLFFIRDSFFHYDECYVWDNYYIDLFISLKAEPNQFKIAIPRSLTIDVNHFLNKSLYADFKYYLAAYNEAEIKSIVNSMQFAKKQGKSIKYRPHPRYSDISLLKKYVDDIDIEWPQQVNILESVSNLDYAVGSYTTVLLQAFFSGKSVLLDDITFQKQYVKLKDLRYILSNVGLPTLSNYQI